MGTISATHLGTDSCQKAAYNDDSKQDSKYMNSFIMENRGLLLLGACVPLGVFSLLWLTEPDSVVDGVSSEEPCQELVDSSQFVPWAIFRGELDDRDSETPPERSQHRTMGAIENRVGSPLEFGSWLSDSRQKLEAADVAEIGYELQWEEFIDSMVPENESIVRAVITEWEQFNIELYRAWTEGQITRQELMDNLLSIEDLQVRLARILHD